MYVDRLTDRWISRVAARGVKVEYA